MYRIFMIEDDEGILNAVRERCKKMGNGSVRSGKIIGRFSQSL